jgi:hypothetical protein
MFISMPSWACFLRANDRIGKNPVGRPNTSFRLPDDTTLHICKIMRSTLFAIRSRLDRAGIVLSGLCMAHCVLGAVLVGALGLGGEALLSPAIHRIGLVLALGVGVVSLGFGVARHGRPGPLLIGGLGLGLMATAIVVGHGLVEAILTILGVSLVAFAHIRNLHACR